MAAAMLVCSAARSRLIVRSWRVAALAGPWPVRILEASSAEVVSRREWGRFSTVCWDRAIGASRSGAASQLVRSVMA